jgi:hypothetical protein
MNLRERLIAAGLLVPAAERAPERIDVPTLALDDRGRVAAARRLVRPEPEPRWIAWRGDDT